MELKHPGASGDFGNRSGPGRDRAEQVFADARGAIACEFAVAVPERTDGWQTGFCLAALAASDTPVQATTISGDDRYGDRCVADYLDRESLMHFPGATLRFMQRTVILDQFTAPLGDAVLGEAAPWRCCVASRPPGFP